MTYFHFSLILFFEIRINFLETCYLYVFYSFYNTYECFVTCKNFLLGLTIYVVFKLFFVLEILIYWIGEQHGLIFLKALYLSFLFLAGSNYHSNLYTLNSTLFQDLFQFLLVLFLTTCFSVLYCG